MKELKKVSIKSFKEQVTKYLKDSLVNIDYIKFHMIFASCRTPDNVLNLFQKKPSLFQHKNHPVPKSHLNHIYNDFYWITKLYIYFVFMRSNGLEKGLLDSPKYKNVNQFFKIMKHDDIRHIRNSIAHGTYEIKPDEIDFKDRTKCVKIKKNNLIKLMKLMDIYFFQCYDEKKNHS